MICKSLSTIYYYRMLHFKVAYIKLVLEHASLFKNNNNKFLGKLHHKAKCIFISKISFSIVSIDLQM